MPPLEQFQPGVVRSTSETWARHFFLVGVFLLPLFMIPMNSFPFALTKTTVFAVALALSFISIAVFSFKAGALRVPFGKIARVVVALLIAYSISSILSQDWRLSLAGAGTETDTLLFITLVVGTFFISAILFKVRDSASSFFATLFTATILVTLFQFARIFFSPFFDTSIFPTNSTTLVGSWNDFGIMVAVLATLSATAIDVRRSRGFALLAYTLILLSSLSMLAIVNFTTLWWLLIATAATVTFASARGVSGEALASHSRFSLSRVPFAMLLIAAVAGVFLAWGSSITPKLQNVVLVSVAEAQLTPGTTIEVTRTTYAQSALTTFFGSGPNTFGQQWLLYKPASLTNSPYWTLDFASGFSSVLTTFLTGGLVAGILFVLIPLLSLLLFIRKIGSVHEPQKREVVITAAALSTLLVGALCFYVPGQVVVLLAFAVLGVFVAGFASEAQLVIPVGRGHFIGSVSVLAGVIVAFICAGALGHRFIGGMYEGKALVAGTDGNMVLAEKYAQRAISLYRSESTLHLMATIKFNQAQTIAAETDTATEATRAQRFQTTISEATAFATAAASEYPKHWATWLTLAQLYEAFIPLKVEGAYQQSEMAYANAIRLSPRNPQLYLMAARMEASANNEQSARNAISQALALKQNYTDAILFLVQIELAKNNLDAALNAAAAAAQTAPDNAGLWLELGVLAYNKGDDATASAALERALSLVPDYANAKYFLGITYYRMGKTGDAAILFEDLARSNPDNTEIAGIRASIQAGKPLFPQQTETPKTAPVRDN